VTRITKRSQHRVLTGLPSLAEEGGVAASGPVDVGFSGWTGYLLVGNPGGGTDTREQFGPAGRRFGKLLKVNLHGIRAVADFPAFEANNPDGGAGALPGEEIDMQAVPTSVVKGPDGAYYVGQLTGFPFPPGGANVFRVVPGHAPKVYAGGFTNIIDIAFDKRGRLYVLEIATGGLLNTPEGELPAGRLVRVNSDGSHTTLASEGLAAPGGFVLRHGAAYITNNSILSDAGQVVKVAI
jgi:hypothetical protein